MPPPSGPPPGSGGGPPSGPPPGALSAETLRGRPSEAPKQLGGGATPKPGPPDWRNKLPATKPDQVIQVPSVSAKGKTQWQPSSSFVAPPPGTKDFFGKEVEPESGAEEAESDESDEGFVAFANNFHAQVTSAQATLHAQVLPQQEDGGSESGGDGAAVAAAAAAREERVAALGAAGAGAVEEVAPEDDDDEPVAEAEPQLSLEEQKKLAAAEAAAAAVALQEDEEEEAAMEAADALDTTVSIGFAETCDDFPHELEPEYFPSKIGGHPAWLHPHGIPVDQNRCPHCAAPLTFLLQIYTGGPAEPFHRPGTFHRTLFLFTCRSSHCHARTPDQQAPFRLWRSQLPLHNQFFSANAPAYGVERPSISITELASPKANGGGMDTLANGAALPCALCGNPASKRCSGCKQTVYCCPEHQKEDWKTVHKLVCTASKSRQLAPPLSSSDVLKKRSKWSLSEYELCVEEEPAEKALNAAEKKKLREYDARKKSGGGMGEVGEDEQKDMEGLNADDPARDPALLQFQLRVARAPDQVVRYRLGGPPMWAGRQAKEHRPEETELPPCGRCGGARHYEFQVQPQLLHYLATNSGSGPCENLDWSTVSCYTCSNSCDPLEDDGGPYIEEYAWRQPGHDLQPGKTVYN